ncbi:MAG: hypothetical protein JNG85_00155 [Spirochaetaceae bacterium]|nr:hypothetical protein [Spirochaetaceae bacterium]
MNSTFTPALWADLAKRIAAAFNMSPEAAQRLELNQTARLVAAIPYVAGCDEPERTALAHLGTFVLASSESCRKAFDHKPADDRDPLARLAPIADFQGGDKALIAEGMRRLAILMTNGYRKDLEKDAKSGEYNPLLSKAWNADTILAELSASKAVSPYDDLLPINQLERSFWEF